MSISSSIGAVFAAAIFALTAFAQQPPPVQQPAFDTGSVKIDLPSDSPLALISTSMGESRATPRGGALVLDLHMGLTLRNASVRRVRGVTLLITTQEFAPGGKGSVARPCIDVQPGQNFTLPVDVRLVRPVQAAAGPMVRVQLDGVLFDDLSFYGPNRLNSQRAMTFWEVEAQRDRSYFKHVLQARGEKALQTEMALSLARQMERPQLDVTLTRNGAVAGTTVASADRLTPFAFLRLPDSPVEAVEGWAAVSGNEARSPRIDVVNRSPKTVRYVEVGWFVKDQEGHQYLAGSVPASNPAMVLSSGSRASLLPDTALKVSRQGHPVEISGMTGFVSEVEFADGKVWVPSRDEINSSPLLRIMAPSPEEQRLADIYSRRGLAALITELNRY